MDAIRYVVMGAWSKIKHWFPREVLDEEIENPLYKEVDDDEYL